MPSHGTPHGNELGQSFLSSQCRGLNVISEQVALDFLHGLDHFRAYRAEA